MFCVVLPGLFLYFLLLYYLTSTMASFIHSKGLLLLYIQGVEKIIDTNISLMLVIFLPVPDTFTDFIDLGSRQLP